MRSIRIQRVARWAASTAVATLILVSATSMAAKDESSADARIQAMTVELKKLEVGDSRNAATAEIGKAEALRDKARSLVGERKERDALTQTLDELDATIALANAKIVEADKQALYDAKKAKLAEVQQQLKQVRSTVATLETEQQSLEAKLGGSQ